MFIRYPPKKFYKIFTKRRLIVLWKLSSELFCVRNVFLVVAKEIMFLKEAWTPEKGFLKG